MTPPSSRVTPEEAPKGGFGIRVLAYIIDYLVLSVVAVVLAVLFYASARPLYYLLGEAFNISYFVYLWSGPRGQTLGMRVFHLKVTKTDGSQLTATGAFLRYVGMIIAALPFFLGLLWVAFDANKQGWHDKIAGTYVVTRWAQPPATGQIAA
jgi:uncharacterized RDD family membrane protein YckC